MFFSSFFLNLVSLAEKEENNKKKAWSRPNHSHGVFHCGDAVCDCSPEPLAVNILTINYFLICLKVTLLATTNKNNVYSIDAEFSRRNLQYIYIYACMYVYKFMTGELRKSYIFSIFLHTYRQIDIYIIILISWIYKCIFILAAGYSSFLLASEIVIS